MPPNPGSCPYLWLASDPSLRLSYADGGHRCFALVGAQEYRPDIEHQQKYCLTEAHPYCPRYHPPSADRPFDPEAFLQAAAKPSPSPLRVVAGMVLGVIALVVVWRLVSALLPPASPPVAGLKTTTPTGAVALVVATPESVLVETDRPKPITTATAPTFVVITNTPTAASVSELLERTIAEATRTATAGPPTAIPVGVVTATSAPTLTPYPLNTETAQAQIVMITVEALTTGTWTPAPAVVLAKTPTLSPAPTFTLAATSTPSPSPTSTPTAEATATPPLTATLQVPFGVTPAVINLLEGAPVGVVLGQFVNVRQGPSTASAPIGQVLQGSQLSLIGRNANAAWLNVCCANGQPGWIATYLLSTDTDVAALPIQPLESIPTPSSVGVLPDSPIRALRRT